MLRATVAVVSSLAGFIFLFGLPRPCLIRPTGAQEAPRLPLAELPAAQRSEAAAIQAVWNRLPDSPAVLYQVAEVFAQAGHKAEALGALRRMTDAHSGLDPRGRSFGSLASDPAFLQLRAEIRRENPPVRKALPAFGVAEADLLPEGIAWSARRQRFYLGSAKRKIVEVDGSGRARELVPSGRDGLGFVLGLRVDDRTGALWAVSEQLGEARDLVRGLFRFRLADGALLARYPIAKELGDLLNDLVVAPDGSVYVTATNSGSLLRITPGGRSVESFLAARALPDPNGIAVTPDGRYLFIAGWYGISRVELATREVRLLDSPRNISAGCIDGLYLHAGALIGIQNCVHDSGRVLRLRLNAERSALTAAEVLAVYDPTFDGITTGAIAGGQFYFVANTQLYKAPSGLPRPGTQFVPLQLLKLQLD